VARVFDFGIGITAEDDASSVIQGVIQDIEGLRHSMTSMGEGTSPADVWGRFDPSLMMPDNDALQAMSQTLLDIGAVLVDISKDTEIFVSALGSAASGELAGSLEEVKFELIEVAKAVDVATPSAEEFAGGLQEVIPQLEEVKPKLQEVAGNLCAVEECAEGAAKSTSLLNKVMKGAGSI